MMTMENTFGPLLLWADSCQKIPWHKRSMLTRIKTALGQSTIYNFIFAGIPDEA